MSTNSKIEWTNHTWNPVTGCTKISQGCKNCYAERFFERFNGKGSFKKITCHNDRLLIPKKWKKPGMVFVNSMSDLFHESVPDLFIYNVFQKMAMNPHLVFQVLTKRPERMMEFCKLVHYSEKGPRHINGPCISFGPLGDPVPIPNVWLGTSIESQDTAGRLDYLLNTPAAVRFISCEPLLGPVQLKLPDNIIPTGFMHHYLHWVIVGGESGPGARPMQAEWVRDLKDQCTDFGIPFFFKQWGGKNKKKAGRLLDGKEYNEMPLINWK